MQFGATTYAWFITLLLNNAKAAQSLGATTFVVFILIGGNVLITIE